MCCIAYSVNWVTFEHFNEINKMGEKKWEYLLRLIVVLNKKKKNANITSYHNHVQKNERKNDYLNEFVAVSSRFVQKKWFQSELRQ